MSTNFKPIFLTRQFDIIPAEKQGISIAIVGAGAVGSFVALSLAKMGFGNMKVYDFDTIDNENMNCQFYRVSDIGKKKTDALYNLITDFTGLTIQTFDTEIKKGDHLNADIIISAVDSMAVRSLIADLACCKFIIDPRMSAEYATIDVVPASKIKDYKSKLFTDAEGVQERCTAKSTMYTVNLIAGQVAKAVKDISLGDEYIKTLDWNIAKNAMIAFSSEGARL